MNIFTRSPCDEGELELARKDHTTVVSEPFGMGLTLLQSECLTPLNKESCLTFPDFVTTQQQASPHSQPPERLPPPLRQSPLAGRVLVLHSSAPAPHKQAAELTLHSSSPCRQDPVSCLLAQSLQSDSLRRAADRTSSHSCSGSSCRSRLHRFRIGLVLGLSDEPDDRDEKQHL